MPKNQTKVRAGKKGAQKVKEKWNKIKEEYRKDPTLCKECDEPLEYSRRDKKFCSRSCSATYNNRKRGSLKEQTKKKISNSIQEHNDNLSKKEKLRQAKKAAETRRKNGNTRTPNVCKVDGCTSELCRENKSGYCKEHWMETEDFQKTIGKYSPRYQQGYIENWWTGNEVFLHSGLEQKYAEYLNRENIKWKSPDPLKYELEDGEHRYYPDFYLIDGDKFIETKGYMWEPDKKKMKAVQDQHDEKDIEILWKEDVNRLVNKHS